MIVPNQRNIKVHFAGMEQVNFARCAMLGGARYGLYTAYSFLAKKFGIKGGYPCKLKPGMDLATEINRLDLRHCIQDSGLFTLMFGSGKGGKYDRKFLERWLHALCDLVLEKDIRATCVEVDCQKVLGVNDAWDFRRTMRERLPGHRIINVFHMEDGRKGLDRLVEFSDYMAISVPELRIYFGHSKMRPHVVSLARYIKQRKPSIDIHLLGCTDIQLLKECSFCSSSDSTAWLGINRFGNTRGRARRDIKDDARKPYEASVREIAAYYGNKQTDFVIKYLSNYAMIARYFWNHYQKAAGDQS